VFIKKEPAKLKMCQDLKEKYETLKRELDKRNDRDFKDQE
jgi:hypothetical protein